MTASADVPLMSVVVATRDDEEAIGGCMSSLMHMAYPAHRREVLVVDDGSSDRTRDIVRGFPVTCLSSDRPGIAHARNMGVEASRGALVVFTDPDCLVSVRWLAELEQRFQDQRVGAVAGAIVPFPPVTLAERYAARRMSHSQLRPLRHPRHPFAMTPNLAFRREALEQAGWFDVRFPGGGWEDADLCWRLRRETGLTLAYAPRAVVFHRYRATPREFLVQHHRYGYGLGVLYGKYPAELSWTWRDRTRAYRELARSLRALGVAALRCRLGGGEEASVGFAYFDLLRQLGQRSGFLRARLEAHRRG